jgi:hypothetical protein
MQVPLGAVKIVDRAGFRLAALSALLAIALAGCGSSGGSSQEGTKGDAQKAVRDWLTAAVDEDGAKYCGLITKDMLEKMTGEQSDQAQTKCEDLVKSKSGSQLPISIFVEAQSASENAGEATVEASLPNGPITLRKEDGEFKVDAVEGGTAKSTSSPEPAKQPSKKQPSNKKPPKKER